MNKTLALTRELISRSSVTPDDAGCQTLMAEQLASCGFTVEHLRFGEVDNLWARWGDEQPILCFAGHTDVVPPGPQEQWHTPPFEPAESDGYLYGRGAADMKSALAAMVTAAQTFVSEATDVKGSLAMLITSDEEGVATHGTVKVIETLQQRGVPIEWAVVGEPSSTESLGDLIRIGRRGSLTAYVTIHGKQGHVAYPDKALNPIHAAAGAIKQLCDTHWDSGNAYFPPTGFQIPIAKAGTGATNVIPGTFDLTFNFRFSTESTAESLKKRTEEILSEHGLKFDIRWHLSGNPFLTEKKDLIDQVVASIQDVCSRTPELSTGGGTSDGRFIAPAGAQVVELGVVNKTIHQVNERVKIQDVTQLHHVYLDIMHRMLGR